MKRASFERRAIPLVLLSILLALLSSCAPEGRALMIVTTNDVKAKTSPCGCHTPKGGLARRAAFLDSLRGRHGDLLVVDAGGFFPETEAERSAAAFMLAEMARMGTLAAGVGQSELHYGYAFAREQARAANLPLLSANLMRVSDGLPAFEAGRVFRVQGVRVGVFGVLKEDADLGPGRDSLRLEPVVPASRRMVEELRAQGAQVVVALSQLGQFAGESLAVHVPGLDLVVGGGGVPMDESAIELGRARVLNGGQQGWYVGLADVRLDGSGSPRRITARAIELGPYVKSDAATSARVKAFEDSLNASLARQDASAAAAALPPGSPRYHGMATCVNCHPSQYAQWRTTPHAKAWQTLVDQRKDSTPRCISCHVTGLGEPGGFQAASDAARLADVQCESCHGMGTDHSRWAREGSRVQESTCRTCHTSETSPTFAFTEYRSHVLHDPPPGLKPLPDSPAKKLMRAGQVPHAH